jgi:hypothetical protein
MSADGIGLPVVSFFATADAASSAIDDAVSNPFHTHQLCVCPNSAPCAFVRDATVTARRTEPEQQPNGVHLRHTC